jgi:hypothetical protein
MLARLFFQPEALASLLGSRARTHRIVLLDDSFSMGLSQPAHRPSEPAGSNGHAQTAERTVFGRAKNAVDRLVRWIREESPDDALTVLVTSRPDQPLRVEPAVGQMEMAGFAEDLEELAPSSRGSNWTAAISAVRQLLDARESHVNATVYLVSDFQKSDWLRPAMEASAQENTVVPTGAGRALKSPAAVLAEGAGANRGLSIVLMDTGVEAKGNLAVTALEPQQAQPVTGVSARYLAKVTNFGTTDVDPPPLKVFVGDAAQPELEVPTVPAGETIEVPVEVVFPTEGAEALSVELGADALSVDNSRTLAVPVARALRVLIVNGEGTADPYQDEVFLLSVALRPEGPQFSGNDIITIDENQLESADLGIYHAVLLANVYRVTEDVAARLEAYVAKGGGVAFFLGDQVDAELYNRILYREGKGILPARLGEVLAPPADRPGIAFGAPHSTHPLTRRFADQQAAFFGGVVAWRYFGSTPAGGDSGGTRPAGATGEGPLATQPAESSLARVLLRFEDEEKSPALIERIAGDGRVLLLTTSIDKEWNNLADRPVFLVLAMEAVQYLARRPSRGGEQLVGQPIQLPLEPNRFQPVAVLKPPRYPEEPATGIYRFELMEVAGSPFVEHVAVNVDSRESDLRRAQRSELLDSMSDLPVSYVSGEELVGRQDVQARRELWPTVLIALVGVLMLEQALAVWFGANRSWRAVLQGQRS